MNTSEVLNKAADLIEERGWIQGPTGWIIADGGPLCLEGGIYAALGDVRGWFRSEIEACPAYQAVEAYVGDHFMGLWQWNDDHDRTAEQVIATLRAVALIEAAKENAETPERVSA